MRAHSLTAHQAEFAGAATISVNDGTTGTGTNQFEFVGSWTAGGDPLAYGGDEHYSNSAGAYAQVRFTGTQVKVYLTKGPKNGIAAFSIDGGPQVWYDTYWPARQNQVLVYTSASLSDGPHILRMTGTGSKNAAASGTYIIADRVDVTSTVSSPGSSSFSVNDGTTGTGTNQFEFVGSWTAGGDPLAYRGDEHYSNSAGAYAQVRFTGTQVKVYLTKGPKNGLAAFSIDGGPQVWYDTYWPARQNQVLVYTSASLSDGPHILRMTGTGSKNAAASGTYIIADRVDVTSTTSTLLPPSDGWRNVVSTDFTTNGVLPAPWKAYNFANSVAGGGYYLASHAVVSGGMVSLVQKYESSGPARNPYYSSTGAGWYQGTIYASGGGVDSVDHRTTVRMRIVSTNGITSHRNLPLWWPNSGNAPLDGEEDFFETDGRWWPAVNGVEQPRSFFHYASTNRFVYWIWTPIDVTQWHTYRFERRNHKITIWVDNMTTPIWSQQYSSTELPDTIKHPTFQQENPNFVPPAGTTGSEEIQIDSIQIDVPS